MILCLADDLTGLAETACMSAARGARWTVWFEARDALRALNAGGGGVVIVGVNLGCRAWSEDAARALVAELMRAAGGAERVYLKTDSVLRGPVAGMIAALRKSFPQGALPILPANPATGRAVRDGKIFVGGVPLDQSTFRDDPLHPARSSQITTILNGANVAVLDGATDADIAARADAWQGSRAACGAAPFGCALFEKWRQDAAPTPASPVPENKHRMLAVVGSLHPRAQAFIEEFKAAGGARRADEADAITALPALIHTGGLAGESSAVTAQLAEAAAGAARRLQCDALYLTGGETAQAVLKALGCRSAEPLNYRDNMAVMRAEIDGREIALLMQPGSYVNAAPLEYLK